MEIEQNQKERGKYLFEFEIGFITKLILMNLKKRVIWQMLSQKDMKETMNV